MNFEKMNWYFIKEALDQWIMYMRLSFALALYYVLYPFYFSYFFVRNTIYIMDKRYTLNPNSKMEMMELMRRENRQLLIDLQSATERHFNDVESLKSLLNDFVTELEDKYSTSFKASYFPEQMAHFNRVRFLIDRAKGSLKDGPKMIPEQDGVGRNWRYLIITNKQGKLEAFYTQWFDPHNNFIPGVSMAVFDLTKGRFIDNENMQWEDINEDRL